MGAWIEIREKLKRKEKPCVAPHVGAWIEMWESVMGTTTLTSHPTWVRGLKYYIRLNGAEYLRSHPTWVRGLKSLWLRLVVLIALVAPHVGAWIEIPIVVPIATEDAGRTPRGCVD